jgi:hypothetical protein
MRRSTAEPCGPSKWSLNGVTPVQGSHDISQENHRAAKAFDGSMQFSVRALSPGVTDAAAIPLSKSNLFAGWWAVIPILMGLTLIALCVWTPAMSELDQLRRDQAELSREVDHAQKQSEVNRQFVTAVQSDSVLRQRLQALRDQSVADRVGPTLASPLDGGSAAGLEPVRLEQHTPSASALSLPQVPMDTSPLVFEQSVPLILRPLTYSTPRVIVLGFGLLLVAWGLLFGSRAG